jgi:prolyl-tRNA synthetase
MADDTPVIVLLRGDHQLNESQVATATGTAQLRAAREDEILTLLGAHPGSLGAVGVLQPSIIADEALRGRARMPTGANRDGFHLRGVNVERDITVTQWADVREAQAGEMSPQHGGPLQMSRCIELGHVFKLGNKYSKAMNAKFLDENGKEQIIEMGCYGIGVSRMVAAVAEAHRDEKGIIWPAALAPFDVHLLLLDFDDELNAVAERLYGELQAAGKDVLFDDRRERPGVKFAEADLFGIPTQVVIGKTTRESGEVEVRRRADKSTRKVAGDAVLAEL